jgi:signal transduction histidine kinase
MSEDQAAAAPGWLNQLVAFARSAEPRTRLTRPAVAADALIAVTFMIFSLVYAGFIYSRTAGIASAVLTSAPLAARRRWPLTTFLVVLFAAIFTKTTATDVTFLAVIFAGYSAAVHSRFRGAALLALAPAGVLMAVFFWRLPATNVGVLPGPPRLTVGVLGRKISGFVGLANVAGPSAPRVGGLLVLVSLVSIAIVGAVMYAGDRIRRMQAEHEAATRRAIEAERARIASELHDVVTHNVSVMIVQAGAARQVLSDSPARARNALLAVEASGRAAMTELRHLLGLLNPAGSTASAGDGAALAEQDLRPQPGMQQLQPLLDRVSSAGLPVELAVSQRRYHLPPGLDLAAFRVIQEALTNVLKHAGPTRTTVHLDYGESMLMVDVADAGRVGPVAGPPIPQGTGRGLIGLRERISLYGGELDAGPRPGGGWRVRACFPVDPAMAAAATDSSAEESAAESAAEPAEQPAQEPAADIPPLVADRQ